MIGRKNTNIHILHDDSLLNSVKRINEGAIMGIVGIINVAGLNFLAVIDKTEVVGQLNRVNINKVTGVSMLPFKVPTCNYNRFVYVCRKEPSAVRS